MSENTELEHVLVSEPSDTDLVQVMLLMRLYDVGMGILAHIDPTTADRIFDAHKEGKDFNPDLYVPEMKQRDVEG